MYIKNPSLNKSLSRVALSQVLNDATIKRINSFIGTIDPRVSTNTEVRNIYTMKFNGGTMIEGWVPNHGNYDHEIATHTIRQVTGIPISKTLYLSYGRKQRVTDESGFKYTDIFFSSDSNVYLLESEKYVMKLYLGLGTDTIEQYHAFQNKLAKQEYLINHNGVKNGLEFQRINVKIIELPEDMILGNEFTSMSFIPFIKGAGAPDNEELEKKNKIIDKIMKEIWVRHGIETPIPQNNPMNFYFGDIHNGTMEIIISDIGASIPWLLEGLGYPIERKSIKALEIFKSKLNTLLHI